MKAIVNKSYGPPSTLQLMEVPKPEPKDNEVLVRVLAASLNKADLFILSGSPFPVRLMAGLFKPSIQILGADVAGIIERVGSKVSQFQVGDAVFGDLSSSGFGGFSEYAVAEESLFAKKPSNLSFEEAASLPMAAVTALQGLRNTGSIAAGESILINGASGGVGNYAIQIAKAFGANVTAVCSTKNREIAKKSGADKVIDYSLIDFTQTEEKYDLILDMVANKSIHEITKILRKNGRYIACAFSAEAMITGPWISLLERKKVKNFLAKTNQADLQFIAKLAEESKLTPNIQQTFTLDDVPEAMEMLGKSGISGKLVITI
ncbi:NAD(P)-dependent alcohol dehydrogenase [Algoriphagus vanfongensis]|uniref:NAD(P)-dependent alcohol dehydrogenase n=1 Tax=Algoriphagus vanfongensis TaxID=426371 RepID=UPI0003FA1B65|nr:NAD(P)-dependent alcohol dehydrogenase [Algoriphagus vanfongensis]